PPGGRGDRPLRPRPRPALDSRAEPLPVRPAVGPTAAGRARQAPSPLLPGPVRDRPTAPGGPGLGPPPGDPRLRLLPGEPVARALRPRGRAAGDRLQNQPRPLSPLTATLHRPMTT